jgi:hypothetical protein
VAKIRREPRQVVQHCGPFIYLHNATILAVFVIFKTVRLAEKVFVSLGLGTEISGARGKNRDASKNECRCFM